MTDNEIIKSMECVIGNDVNCSECDYQKSIPFPSCRMMCAKNALDLINRQKEENERLKCEMEKLLPKDCSYAMQMEVSNKLESQIKSEAIIEFWERLKEEIRCEDDCGYHCYGCGYECKDYVIAVDNLVKEMTEVENDRA